MDWVVKGVPQRLVALLQDCCPKYPPPTALFILALSCVISRALLNSSRVWEQAFSWSLCKHQHGSTQAVLMCELQ